MAADEAEMTETCLRVLYSPLKANGDLNGFYYNDSECYTENSS